MVRPYIRCLKDIGCIITPNSQYLSESQITRMTQISQNIFLSDSRTPKTKNLPKVKTTPRSYSRSTFKLENKIINKNAAIMSSIIVITLPLHATVQPLNIIQLFLLFLLFVFFVKAVRILLASAHLKLKLLPNPGIHQ